MDSHVLHPSHPSPRPSRSRERKSLLPYIRHLLDMFEVPMRVLQSRVKNRDFRWMMNRRATSNMSVSDVSAMKEFYQVK